MVRTYFGEPSLRFRKLGEDCQYDEDGDGLANGEDLCPKNKLIKDKQVEIINFCNFVNHHI